MSTPKPSKYKPQGTFETIGSELQKSGMNSKSVRIMSDNSDTFQAKKPTAIGKSDARYWLQTGKLYSDARCAGALFCKIQVGGRRESFPLRTTNRAAAAAKAAKIAKSPVVSSDTPAKMAKPTSNSAKPRSRVRSKLKED